MITRDALTRKKRLIAMSPEEAEAYMERKRAYERKYRANLSPEKKAEIKAKKKINDRNRYLKYGPR